MTKLMRVIALLCLLMAAGAAKAGNNSDTTYTRPAASEKLTASLVTCYPGPQIFELCGHEAIRIRGIDEAGLPVDSVWNYGVFDFNSPNFIYRFVKGETDYMVLGYPFRYFLPEYEARGSKVVEQDLNLTAEEVARLRSLLQTNSLPANRVYRYNYVRDNCSTRIVAMVDSAAAADIVYPDSVSHTTFRKAMRHYHRGYPWYQFGIDLALGSLIDVPVNSREEMFVPMQLEQKAASAHYSDGRKLVKEQRILAESRGDPRLPATPFWLSPVAAMLMLMLVSGVVAALDIRRKRLSRWWYAVFYSLLGLAGCVIWFLVFVSSHYATSPNILALWLSPLQLIIPVCVWIRCARPAVTAMIWINILMTGLLLLVWPFQAQSANPAFFPLMAADLILCAGYIYSGGHNTSASTGRNKSGRKNVKA